MRLHSIFIITLSKSDVHDILCKSEVCFQDSMTGAGNGMVSIGTQSGRRFPGGVFPHHPIALWFEGYVCDRARRLIGGRFKESH